MTPESTSRGRRNYLINPGFQLRFVGFTLAIAAAAIAVFYISNHYFIWKFIEIGKSLNLPPDHPFFRFIAEQRAMLNSVFIVTSLVAALAIVIGGLLLSHRIAGPIHRMREHLEDIAANGRVRELNFRQGDYFPEMAESINKALHRLSK